MNNEEFSRRMVDQLVRLVVPLTRFDADTLIVRSGSFRRLHFLIERRFDVQFKCEYEDGAGNARVHQVGTSADLARHVEQRLGDLRTRLPRRIEHWASERAISGRDLTVGDCFDGPEYSASESKCWQCAGAGRHQCVSCQQSGKITCNRCRGRGKEQCSNYNCSFGRVPCSQCGGRGFRSESGPVQSWDYSANASRTDYRTVDVPCDYCNRGGTLMCSYCAGTGERLCSGCGGSGICQCSECAGTGWLGCDPCKSTGIVHRVCRIDCEVRPSSHAVIDSGDDDLDRQVRAISLDTLREISDIRPFAVIAMETGLVLRHPAELQVHALSVAVGAVETRLLGFGPDLVISDYKGIVDNLLRPDLEALKAATQAQSRWSLAPSPAMVEAMNRFIASEANVRIAHDVRSRGDAERLHASIGRAVSIDHATEAASLIDRALRRATTTSYLAYLAVTPLITGLAWILGGLPAFALLDGPRVLITVGAMIVCMLLGEILFRKNLVQRHGAEAGRQFVSVLRARRNLVFLRISIVLFSSCMCLLMWFAEPHVDNFLVRLPEGVTQESWSAAR